MVNETVNHIVVRNMGTTLGASSWLALGKTVEKTCSEALSCVALVAGTYPVFQPRVNDGCSVVLCKCSSQ